MKYNLLSQMKVRSLGAGKHNDGQGLYLVKKHRQGGKWIQRLSINGKRREMGLGRWPDVSIAEAREKAIEARSQLRSGNDPIVERDKLTRLISGTTVAEVIAGCFEARKAELKNDGIAGRWLSPLNVHIIPKIGKLPIEQLDQHELKSVMEPIWHDKPEAAAKALSRVNLAIKHAAALGLEVDMQAVSKAKALLGKQRRSVQHIPSMPYADVPSFYQWLAGQSKTSVLALRFLILTAARTSEVRLATFDEIDGDIWYLSAERTKTGREHRIPLTDEALRVVQLARDIAENEFLFSSYRGKPLSDAGMSKLMKEHDYEARPHGFRSSFRVWAEEQTEATFEVKEACLGHIVDGGVVGAYQRSDRLEKRRIITKKWSKFLLS
tara:strand:- start:26133 stop:27272 length:1140 start_codon:yes stop_codon:yes gene_type:complete